MGTKKLWVVIGALLLAVLTGGGALAMAQGAAPTPSPQTASDVYGDGMSLETISKLSVGKPGDVAPPCPAESLVTRLKAAGLPIGPCDPLPEVGQPIILPTAAATPNEESGRVCGDITMDGPTVALPCGEGMEVLSTEFPVVNGESCARVTYVPARGLAKVTDTLCPSSPIGAGGARMVLPSDETVAH